MRNGRIAPLKALFVAILHIHILLHLLLHSDSAALLISKKYLSMLFIFQAGLLTMADIKNNGYSLKWTDNLLLALESVIAGLFSLTNWQWIICTTIKGYASMLAGSVNHYNLNRHIFATLANGIPFGGKTLFALYKLWTGGASWYTLSYEFATSAATMAICFGILVFLANALRGRWSGVILFFGGIMLVVWVIVTIFVTSGPPVQTTTTLDSSDPTQSIVPNPTVSDPTPVVPLPVTEPLPPAKPWEFPDLFWWLREPWTLEATYIFYTAIVFVVVWMWIVMVQENPAFQI